jgi:hypothetical protein
MKGSSIRKTQNHFKASNYMVQTTNKLVVKKGLDYQEIMVKKQILLSSILIPDKVLPPATDEIMKQFLISDEVGRFQKETKNYIYFN